MQNRKRKKMVSIGTIIGLSAIGLIIFFQKDISVALNNLKGFGSSFGQDFGKIPDVTINVPDFGIPEAFAETGKVAEDIGAGVQEAFGQAGENINQFGIDVQKNIADSIAGAQKGIDESIKGTQEAFEQFGTDVQTNFGIIGAGITDFFGGISPKEPITTVSEATPTIISRRAGTSTRFGGQTAPKEILTKETASTPDLIISAQPDKSLVSPFLTGFNSSDPRLTADPDKVPENFFLGIPIVSSRRTGTTGGR